MLGSITKENFNQLLGRFSTTELENLIEKHPYFQQAHILLAKKYQQENNPKFDEQLQMAALYSQDREFLFSVFQEVSPSASFNIQLPVFKTEPTEEVKPGVIEESLSNSAEVEEIKAISPEVEEVTVHAIQPEEEIVAAQKPKEEIESKELDSEPLVLLSPTSESTDNTVSDNTNSGITIEEVKLDIIEESLNTSAEVEEIQTISPDMEEVTAPAIQPEGEILVVQNLQEEIVIEEPVSEPLLLLSPTSDITDSAVGDNNNSGIITIQQDEPVSLPVVEESKETFAATEPHTFDEWLTAFAQHETIKLEFHQEPLPEEPEKQDEELEQLIMSNSKLHELVEEEAHYSKGLDVFIEEQKQKHKPQEARKSSDENEMAPELITETMAKIYEMQNKYSKAIRAYEILALKYPKKNDFFAARINYLKNII